MSEIRATTISDTAGTGPVTLTGQYAAKAWVNFNGTGTVAIRESGNVGSITDNGTGDYTVNFSTAMGNSNHAPVHQTGNASSAATGGRKTNHYNVITTSVTLRNQNASNADEDRECITFSTFGDLA